MTDIWYMHYIMYICRVELFSWKQHTLNVIKTPLTCRQFQTRTRSQATASGESRHTLLLFICSKGVGVEFTHHYVSLGSRRSKPSAELPVNQSDVPQRACCSGEGV